MGKNVPGREKSKSKVLGWELAWHIEEKTEGQWEPGKSRWGGRRQSQRPRWGQMRETLGLHVKTELLFWARGKPLDTVNRGWLTWMKLALAAMTSLDWGKQTWKLGDQLGKHCNNPGGIRWGPGPRWGLGMCEKWSNSGYISMLREAEEFQPGRLQCGGRRRSSFWREDGELGVTCVTWGCLGFKGDSWAEIYIWKKPEINTSYKYHPEIFLAGLSQEMLWILISHHSEAKGNRNQHYWTMSQSLSWAFKIYFFSTFPQGVYSVILLDK